MQVQVGLEDVVFSLQYHFSEVNVEHFVCKDGSDSWYFLKLSKQTGIFLVFWGMKAVTNWLHGVQDLVSALSVPP